MKKLHPFLLLPLLAFAFVLNAQTIADFTSVEPLNQNTDLVIPSTHGFQYIIQHADPLTAGGNMPDDHDFSGYVPVGGSSTNGYLSINSERFPGGVTVLDINLDNTDQKWIVTASEKIDFTPVVRTAYNCSGAVTEWGTVISCEEVVANDGDKDGYKDLGWNVEIDPTTKTVIDKLWAMGNFAHENVAIHSNKRTVYQGADSDPGYIFKYVADVAEDLSSGKLYVYKGSKNGSGDWILLANTTKAERNSTLQQCANVGATVFKGVEDLEIGPDGKIYAAVSDECVVYRFDDSDPLTGTTVSNFETFVGGMNYDIDFGSGTVSEPWGCGNDNLAFDGEGNLWVLQDGDKNYIWVVKNGHTQTDPLVELFGISPLGSEPTGITFTPDFKYMFMSVMHPASTNTATTQQDAFGKNVGFGKDITIAIALNENFGPCNITVDAGDDQSVYFGYPPAECATLTASTNGGTPPYSYQWSTGEITETITVCPFSTTTYTVTATDAEGCSNDTEVTVNVTDVRCGKKLNKVEICHISEDNPDKPRTICVSQKAVPAHLAHGDYLGSCNNAEYGNLSAGNNLKLSHINGTPILTDSDWRLYPNPAINNTVVDITQLLGYKVQLTVFDASGKAFFTSAHKILEHAVMDINTSSIPAGVYYVVLNTDAQSMVKKLVIMK